MSETPIAASACSLSSATGDPLLIGLRGQRFQVQVPGTSEGARIWIKPGKAAVGFSVIKIDHKLVEIGYSDSILEYQTSHELILTVDPFIILMVSTYALTTAH